MNNLPTNDLIFNEENVVSISSQPLARCHKLVKSGGEEATVTPSVAPQEHEPHDCDIDEISHPLNRIDDDSQPDPPSITPSNDPGSQTTECEQTDEEIETMDINRRNQRLPARQSLGLLGCVTIFGGSLLILPFLGFLLFLWGGAGSAPGGSRATTLWRVIMLNGWALQSVTLSCLTLRVITAAQAGVCTSLLAALLAERQYSPMTTIAKLSVLRGVNGSPLHLLRTMRSLKAQNVSQWPWKELMLASILTLSSLAIQFSSTILISDFDGAVLTQFPIKTRRNVALSESTLNINFVGSVVAFKEGDGWSTFGGKGATDLAKPDIRGLSDTGLQQRAFLPYDKANRTTLRSFKGPTAVMSSRISCIPPALDATFTPIYPDSTYPYGSINGTILFNATFGDVNLSANACSYDILHNTTACIPPVFSCTVANGLISGSEQWTEWVPSLCHLIIPEIESTVPDNPPTEFYSIDDIIGASAGRWNRFTDPWDEAAYWPFLVIVTNARIDLLKTMNETGTLSLPLQPYQRFGEWNSFKLTDNSVINITMCSAGFNMSLAYVELSSNSDPVEPSVKLNATTLSLDGERIQTLLGASDIQDPGERGILSLENIEYLNSTSSAAGIDYFQPGMDMESFGSILLYNSLVLWQRLGISVRGWNQGVSVGVCSPCWGWTWATSRDIAVLFTRIINTSGRAALAIDAVLYAVMSTWYYDLLPGFNVPGTVEASFSKACSIPRRWWGAIVVTSLVIIHLVCVLTIALRYLRLSRYSRQGNIWHTVSQLVSTRTSYVLDIGNDAGDEVVAEMLQGNDTLAKIDYTESGRVGIIAKLGEGK
ncbi:hypothetical protein RRF57_001416 [Xylaria bambusicola]|uniref:Uncharacterized protein n=1 Tax=Xylaria bambusicola TaxID=326684 RepID=A0AAN7YUX3_9PEZI